MKQSVKFACHVANSNIAIGALPTLQISIRFVALFEKIHNEVQIVTVFLLKYRGGCTIPLFQLDVWCEKFVAARHDAVICKHLLI